MNLFSGIKFFTLTMMAVGIQIAQAGEFGIIDAVYHDKQAVVIDDQYFAFALNTEVLNESKAVVNRYAIKKGQEVYYERNLRTLTQLTILPKDFVRPTED